MVGMDWPKRVDVGNGAENCVTALTFFSNCFPLKVEAWMAYDDCVFGEQVGVAIAYGVEAQYWVGDVGGVFVIFEHMGLNPYVPVGVMVSPGGASVYPDS